MATQRNYHDQVIVDNNLKLRELLKSLPAFCGEFFRGIEPTTSSRTRIAYGYDLSVFFNYLKSNNPKLKDVNIHDITLDVLDKVTATDIEEYLDYLKFYVDSEGKEHTNKECGIKRKLGCLRTLYKFFYKKEKISTNPASIVDMPKIHEKEIVRLDADEVGNLLDEVETGDKLTDNQKYFHEKTKVRDVAILTLMLGTGIRVSECVGIDIGDVDFKNSGIKIRRKGGNETVVYFGREVEEALLDYIEERKHVIAITGHENALFLSLQKKRMSVRSVEKLVKKYSSLITNLKKITPHKLRSTYGTSLYKETGDIYLVADVLGHKDVNTTRKHYAAIEDERRRKARNAVKLRKD